MKIKYHKILKLPKLAWCAVAVHEHNEINIYHGDSVETFENFFVEGAWDGDFSCGEFDNSSFFMGSGGKLLKYGSGGGYLLHPAIRSKEYIASRKIR